MTHVCVFVPLCLFLSSLHHVFGAEVSLWNIIINNNEAQNLVFRKTLYSNTSIFLKFQGDEAACNQKKLAFNVSWYLRSSICYNEVFGTPDSAAETMFGSDHMLKEDWGGFYSQGYVYFDSCQALLAPKIYYKAFHPFLPLKPQEDKSIIQTRHVLTDKPYFNMVAKSWTDGPYLFIVRFETLQLPDESNGRRETEDEASNSNDYLPVTMTVEMKGSHDYSSPADRPLMIFFMTMCIVYVLFGALWLLWLACYWRDLLRIQFCISAVIVLGMLEKAVFYSEYQRITYHGAYNQSAVIFAELVSALKRSLARVLLIIVSLGYGIVKPRLGTTVPKLVAVGLLYLIFSSVEGVLRVTGGFYGTVALIASVSLSLTDSCVIWWIFISLSQTTRLLKLRRNVVKLSLYQHFTKTLIFSVLASIIFLVWTTKQFKFVDCQSGWRDLWVDDAFWRLLFSTILLVIMVLLRPSINSQRFSHSPLIEEDDEEDAKEPMLNEAFEGMKMRGAKSEANSSNKDSSKESSHDEDLKWVEENIPTSIDVSLPVILDDEEELLKTKLERSKME
ncbi:transmembrane protein 87A-like isoform X2 [Tachysurus fulvidraco]|uniref:transmembrane protein 87A-like isoform X2 n=1 Tax=Tachysurus fulvidraco TaxID=1234273 RepID=UPI001FEEE366|nr:transmembrane protein 87A-like isoform X2 [Tachysurus fulvidraco]